MQDEFISQWCDIQSLQFNYLAFDSNCILFLIWNFNGSEFSKIFAYNPTYYYLIWLADSR